MKMSHNDCDDIINTKLTEQDYSHSPVRKANYCECINETDILFSLLHKKALNTYISNMTGMNY